MAYSLVNRLRAEYDRLRQAIEAELSRPRPDVTRLRRLKTRKVFIKDQLWSEELRMAVALER